MEAPHHEVLEEQKEEARDEDLSQGHGAKLGIEAWSACRMKEHCGEHRKNKQSLEDMMLIKLFTCRRKEHCVEHRENKQSRRADATETFPITSYKVDIKKED